MYGNGCHTTNMLLTNHERYMPYIVLCCDITSVLGLAALKALDIIAQYLANSAREWSITIIHVHSAHFHIVLYCTILYCTVLYYTVLSCIVLYCIVLYCTVLYCTVLYCTVLYCAVLYCVLYFTILYCTTVL